MWPKPWQAGAAARVRVAVDLPSGVSTDDGSILSPVPDFDLTVTFADAQALASVCSRRRATWEGSWSRISAWRRRAASGDRQAEPCAPGPDDQNIAGAMSRWLAGEMPGRERACGCAAARAGAGYVRLIRESGWRASLTRWCKARRGASCSRTIAIGAVASGPGSGRGPHRRAARSGVSCERPLVLDADALFLLDAARLSTSRMCRSSRRTRASSAAVRRATGSKVEAAARAAAETGGVIVYKGRGLRWSRRRWRAAIAPPAPAWLASAGTGDVLAGIIAAMRARGMDAFDAACAGVWLHGRACRACRSGIDRGRLDRRASSGSSGAMSEERIVRIAARGDGVTESGRFFPSRRGRSDHGDGTIVPGRTTRCRHAATFRNAGAARSSSWTMTVSATFLVDRNASCARAAGA
jgi:NAD(P)H-hydrate repair Nnr-like enzyme with NAD(P)H-hydrate dehydratase domain